MSPVKRFPPALLAAAVLLASACADGVSLPEAASAPPGPQFTFGPNGSSCWEGSLFTTGDINITSSQIQFSAASRNDCWQGTVHVQADLYWGAVSDCSQPVPKMIDGYGSPDPNQNFYENPATGYLAVSRTHPRPVGSLVKARMVRTHRFWHWPYGPYGGPYEQIVEESEACSGVPYTPFTGLSLDACSQQECNFSQTIWGCQTFTVAAVPTGSGPFTYQWQDFTSGSTNTFQVCPYSTGEPVFRQIWVNVTDQVSNTTMSRMINWTFYDGNQGGGGCPECH